MELQVRTMGLAAKLNGTTATTATTTATATATGLHQLAPGENCVTYCATSMENTPTPNASHQDPIERKLRLIIQQNNLHAFYTETKITDVVNRVKKINFHQLAADWKISLEMAVDLASLALYDVVILGDDSGSMYFEPPENPGERIEDLKAIVARTADLLTKFDDDGISIRFLNSNVEKDNLTTGVQVEDAFRAVTFSGTTPLGTKLYERIIKPYLNSKYQTPPKPLMVLVITDGCPSDGHDTFKTVVLNARNELERRGWGPNSIAIQVAQVGDDEKARQYLEYLDNDREVGGVIDCTSNYEFESMEMKRNNINMTVDMWLVKILVGAIDQSYDSQDNSTV
jgi:hypothetical protein